MKKVENTFAVTGFMGKDAEIRQFTTSSVARFPLAISRTEKRGEDQEETRTSAFIKVEAWRKNESASFELLKKKTMITVKRLLQARRMNRCRGQETEPCGVRGHQVL